MNQLIKDMSVLLKKYEHIIALSILIMLIVLSILTYTFFEKQNEIIETGGYTDGKIKCVCTQEAVDEKEMKLNLSDLNLNG